MSRGIGSLFPPKGMTIDDDQVGVRPTGVGTGLTRGFSTELPAASNQAQIQAGKQLQDVGVELMAQVAKKDATEAAYSAKIERDPTTGKWVRPEAPLGYGLATSGVYDQIVDQRFVEEVYRDTEGTLNTIAAQHFNDPEVAGAKMRATVEGTLKNVPEGMASRLAPILGREFNERQRGVVSTYHREQYNNEVRHLGQMEEYRFERARSALLVGDHEQYEQEMELLDGVIGRKVAMNAEDPGSLQLSKERRHSMAQSVNLLRAFEEAAERGDAKLLDGVDRVQQFLRGGGSDEDEVYGVTKKGIAGSILTQRERDGLAVRLGQIGDDYLKKQTAAQKVASVDDYEKFHLTYGPVKNPNLNAKDEGALVAGLMQKHQMDPFAGSTVEKLYRLTGAVPEGYYKEFFFNAQSKSPEFLMRSAEAYKAIVNLKGADGRPVGETAGIIADKDAAYMHLFTQALEQAEGYSSQDPLARKQAATEAAKVAGDLYRRGADTLKEARDPLDLVHSLRVERGEAKMEREAIVADVTGKLDSFLGSESKTLTLGQRSQLTQSVAGLMATGQMSYEQARDQAVARFKNTHQPDPYVIAGGGKAGGWVHRDYAVPEITDPHNGGTTKKWVWGAVLPLFDVASDGTFDKNSQRPLIPKRQHNFDIKDIKPGENLFLQPTGSSTDNKEFRLWYRPSDQVPGFPLQNQNGREITVRLGEEAKAQDAAARAMMKNGEHLDRIRDRALKQGIGAGSEGLQIRTNAPEVYPLAQAVKPLDILDPTVLRDDGPPVWQQTNGRGERSRGLDLSRRKDGLPERLIPLPGMNPNAPAPGAHNTSLTGESGFRIPGTDLTGAYNLRAYAADHVNLSVENRAGPRAGQVVQPHPELAGGLAKMIEEMPGEIRSGFRINSMVRSYEQQEDIYRSTVMKRGEGSARKWAALPGHSLHEDGRAADLKMSPAARAWVHQNAGRYGLHFPLAHEPWHVEPVGARRRAAKDDDADSEFEPT